MRGGNEIAIVDGQCTSALPASTWRKQIVVWQTAKAVGPFAAVFSVPLGQYYRFAIQSLATILFALSICLTYYFHHSFVCITFPAFSTSSLPVFSVVLSAALCLLTHAIHCVYLSSPLSSTEVQRAQTVVLVVVVDGTYQPQCTAFFLRLESLLFTFHNWRSQCAVAVFGSVSCPSQFSCPPYLSFTLFLVCFST